MALEWAQHGITVNAVAPGHTATPMNFDAEQLDGSTIERPVIPLARAGSAEEIASAIAWLASPEASYATGASLLVDGGLLLPTGPQALYDATGR
jgi:NAD(P)-dependent dehydrogenase (short-subunit alcohol dehydrogenase family)